MNWLDQLQSLRESMPADQSPSVDADATAPEADSTNPATEARSHPRLDIAIERKGRAGKTATLITGWQLPDSELRTIASDLKQRLGVGGSARGGDILIQGDYRTRVLQLLTAMGYRARII